jgi:hypothetical protein
MQMIILSSNIAYLTQSPSTSNLRPDGPRGRVFQPHKTPLRLVSEVEGRPPERVVGADARHARRAGVAVAAAVGDDVVGAVGRVPVGAPSRYTDVLPRIREAGYEKSLGGTGAIYARSNIATTVVLHAFRGFLALCTYFVKGTTELGYSYDGAVR